MLTIADSRRSPQQVAKKGTNSFGADASRGSGRITDEKYRKNTGGKYKTMSSSVFFNTSHEGPSRKSPSSCIFSRLGQIRVNPIRIPITV